MAGQEWGKEVAAGVFGGGKAVVAAVADAAGTGHERAPRLAAERKFTGGVRRGRAHADRQDTEGTGRAAPRVTP